LAFAAVLASPRIVQASTPDRVLAFRHLHTGETLTIGYARHGAYVPEALARIDRCLRDHVNGAVHPIDPKLLDYLHDLRTALASEAPIEVVCGYRSPHTNATAAARSKLVDPKSLHTVGRAIDLRLPARRADEVARAALGLKRGGVGAYLREGYVHLDTGAVRSW
jgi:uncharacterized protein YcbK (DUF882 family)